MALTEVPDRGGKPEAATSGQDTGGSPQAADGAEAVGRPAERSTAFAAGSIVGISAGLFYTVGWDRAFSYDASRTVQQFVAVDSAGSIFRQDRFNNHPLFSLVDHLVYAATSSDDERLLRVAPIVFAALAVGMVATAVAKRFGAVPGCVAGATLAVNAPTVCHCREVRGYSLVMLAAVVGTLALFKRMRAPTIGPTVVYAGAMAVAIGTHLFVLVLLVLHVVIVLSTQPRRIWGWLGPWAVAAGLGLAVQAPAIVDGLGAPPVRRFNPMFPWSFSSDLLSGGPALPGMLLLVISGWTVLRSRPWVNWVMAATALMAGAAWLAAPSWLSPRFFVWLVPATAVAAGVAVARRPRLAYVAAACVVVQVAGLAPRLTTSEVPNRVAAGFVRAAQREGASVCALGRTRASLRAYAGEVPVVWDIQDLAGCELAVEASPGPQPLLGAACERFAYVLVLPARQPGAILADHPLALVPEFVAEAHHDAGGWERTSTAPLCAGPSPLGYGDHLGRLWRGWWCS